MVLSAEAAAHARACMREVARLGCPNAGLVGRRSFFASFGGKDSTLYRCGTQIIPSLNLSRGLVTSHAASLELAEASPSGRVPGGKVLMVVESDSKAEKISKFLGNQV